MTRTDDTDTDTNGIRPFTVTCSNCGKEQASKSRHRVDPCDLCGKATLTDRGKRIDTELNGLLRATDGDPVKLRRGLRKQGPSYPGGRATRSSPEMSEFEKRTMAGMGVLAVGMFVSLPLYVIGHGYWMMMTGATVPTESASVSILLMIGTCIIAASVLYTIGDLSVRARDRLLEDDTNE